MPRLAVAALAVLVCALSASHAAALTIIPQAHSLTATLASADVRCFYTVAKGAEDRMYFHYQVRTGTTDFSFHVNHPDGSRAFFSDVGEHDHEGKIFLEAKTWGEYSICFDNTAGTRSEKSIMISTAVMSKKKATRKVDPLVKSLAKTEASLIALIEDQIYIRSREREHRETLESNNTRIAVRGLIEMFVMLAMSVGQVYYLRKLFAKKAQRAA